MSHRLPDGGAELHRRRALLYDRLKQIKSSPDVDLVKLASGNVFLTDKGLKSQARMLTTGAVEHLHA